jgi:hypothetical protein
VLACSDAKQKKVRDPTLNFIKQKHKQSTRFKILMVSGSFRSGYIVSEIVAVGLEHKQKLELRLSLDFLFAGSFG